MKKLQEGERRKELFGNKKSIEREGKKNEKKRNDI